MLLCLVSSNLFCKQTRIGRGSSQWDGEELLLWVQHKRCLASCHVLIRMETLETSAYDVIIKNPKVSEKELGLCSKTHPPPLLIFASISTSCEKWQLDPVARDVQGASDGKAVP